MKKQSKLALWFVLLLVFLLPPQVMAQGKKVRLVHADKTVYNKKVIQAQRLIGHVQLTFDGTLFNCDSAYFFENENFQAFGNIRVNKPGEYTISGKRLFFNKANQLATLNENGVFTDGDMTLTAPTMNYNFNAEVATFSGGGKIISSKNKNVLTAQTGRYHSPSNQFTFRRKVTVKNDEYTVVSDTMLYNSLREESFFFGPTTISSNELKIKCIWGSFNSKTEKCVFTKRATVEEKKFILIGDSIFFDGKTNNGEAFGNVVIKDLEDGTTAYGDYGNHNESASSTFITKRAYIKRPLQSNDSLFLTADSLYILGNNESKKMIYAYRDVLFYSNDFQGKCDSLSYSENDSLLHLFYSPVVWSDNNQLSGKKIELRLKDNQLSSLFIPENAFLISLSKREFYNQIRGTSLTSKFENKEIQNARFVGNSELLYYPLEEKKGSSKLTGRNAATCSEIELRFEKNKITEMNLVNEANSSFAPVSQMNSLPKSMEGFDLRIKEKPTSKEAISGVRK
jgi:lipopolysaccharide export system protein LptA